MAAAGLAPVTIVWLLVGLAGEATSALQSWCGCRLGCGGRRRRQRQNSYARLARRPHAGAAQCARTPRSQAVRGRRAARGRCYPDQGTWGRGRKQGKWAPKVSDVRQRLERCTHGRTVGRSARRGGGPPSAAFLKEVLSGRPGPSHLAATTKREEFGVGWLLKVLTLGTIFQSPQAVRARILWLTIRTGTGISCAQHLKNSLLQCSLACLSPSLACTQTPLLWHFQAVL
uniref:uncharacterized protein LOC117703255 n=1 Tax=Arvicanthis niloticus TaxID=61156 RepID=UPI001486FAA7|nr:uncharacterized protein LOC117703255 [Arvicanthis niloticus]